MYILFIPIIQKKTQFYRKKIVNQRYTFQTISKKVKMSMMCGRQDHHKYFSFCEVCAIQGKDYKVLFFCSDCQRDIKKLHRKHEDEVISLKNVNFIQPLTQLKSIIISQIQSLRQIVQRKSNIGINFGQTMNKLKVDKLQLLKLIDDNQSLVKCFLNQNIMKWLIQIKFWEARNRTLFIQYQSRVKSNIQQKITQIQNDVNNALKDANNQDKIQKEFKIQWSEGDQKVRAQIQSTIQSEISDIYDQNKKRKQQIDICNLIIKLFTAFNRDQLLKVDDECEQLIKLYPKSKVLYLARIRINQLVCDGHQQIKSILNKIKQKIDPNFQSTDLYHYYMAMSKWEMIDQSDKEKSPIFFQLKNKKYYKLVKVDQYIGFLQKAIAVKCKPPYLMSLGIGYIVKQNYQQAIRVFKQAILQLNKRNDALDINKFWAEIKFNQNGLEFQSIMENLQTRTLQFITNISRYFKKSKNYSQLVQCCEQLIQRQPQNSNFQIQFIKSILSFSSTLSQYGKQDTERLQIAQMKIIELKRAQDLQASKLQKRLDSIKAKYQFKNKNYYQAGQAFQKLANGTKLTTASDYYNFSATIFKLFREGQCTDQQLLKTSYQNINKALQLKPNNLKYKKLKFFVCSFMNKFNEADKVCNQLKKQNKDLINWAEYQRLIQYVKDNLEEQTPGQ